MDRLPEWAHHRIRNLAGMWVQVPPAIALPYRSLSFPETRQASRYAEAAKLLQH